MAKPARILLVEDEPTVGRVTQRLLEKEGYEVEWAHDGTQGLELATHNPEFDLVLSDFRMPGMGGLELLERLRELYPHLPVVLMTAHGTSSLAIEATRKGAFDYLLKPYQPDDLYDLVAKGCESARLTRKRVSIGSQDHGKPDSDAIIGNSRAMQELYKEMGRVTDKVDAVLIRGEAGTEKELIARSVWQHSDRADKTFIAVNCATIPGEMLESELFGHEKGAFPGATTRRIGRIEQADQGTLFLNEFGEVAPHTQAKLLLLLQQNTITRVGGQETIPAKVRLIVATSRELERAIEETDAVDHFLIQLNAAPISIPPLRERGADISLLAVYFLERFSRALELPLPELEQAALRRICQYRWPGNTTELESVIRNILLRSQGYPISAALVEEFLREAPLAKSTDGLAVEHRVRELLQQAEAGEIERIFSILQEEFERTVFSEAIKFTHGNQSMVSRLLGVSRVTLREKLDKYQLFPKRDG